MEKININSNFQKTLDNINIEGGHAELEDNDFLYIYGNAYEVIL
jgi:hypothetical protein